MRKISYVLYIVLGSIGFICMVYAAIFKQDMKLFGLSCFMTFFSFLTAFIAEPRPTNTYVERHHDERCQSWGIGMLMLVTITAAIACIVIK
jgi:magnesium-transporting ATPase (P-type)